jgi:hypothetical protein
MMNSKKYSQINLTLLNMKKIINFTPTGTQPTRENSYAPLLPNEIIEVVHEANELGFPQFIYMREMKKH